MRAHASPAGVWEVYLALTFLVLFADQTDSVWSKSALEKDMENSVRLSGYRYSVYNRIARLVLHEKGVDYEVEELNPFAATIPADHLRRHPFGRVPILTHGDFEIYETGAITRYIDAAFGGPKLVPTDARSVARAAQVMSVIDNYGYQTMIRQVFAHRVFRPAEGEQADEAEISAGIAASRPVLGALNAIADEACVLDGQNFTIADCHLAPMIAYFVQAPEGAELLTGYSVLSNWWTAVSGRKSLRGTDPGLPGP